MSVGERIGCVAPAGARSRRALAGAALSYAALLALAGCGASEGAGALLVDPGHYNAYHCDALAARAKVLAAREKELHDLMARASQGGGGAIIGSLAYRSDYDSVLGEERLVQRVAAEKNCSGAATQFQSDQTIR